MVSHEPLRTEGAPHAHFTTRFSSSVAREGVQTHAGLVCWVRVRFTVRLATFLLLQGEL